MAVDIDDIDDKLRELLLLFTDAVVD